jgi:hypothetical protein
MSMSSRASDPWLFFLFNLPGKRASERVKVWRRLKKFGAIQLKSSAYVLPDESAHYERFQEIQAYRSVFISFGGPTGL